uniref:Peptidase S1 domain-containing protein n=1 Tax=Anopheles farauti TaxID=69004 RepID=A0A182QY70_9DIPT
MVSWKSSLFVLVVVALLCVQQNSVAGAPSLTLIADPVTNDLQPAARPYTTNTLKNILQAAATIHRCTATVLNPNWLLTSGHCTTGLGPFDTLSIVCGVRIYRTVEQIVPHPNNSVQGPMGSMASDLALLRMRKALNFTSNVQPIPVYDGAELPDAKVTIASFGRSDDGSTWWNPLLQIMEGTILPTCACHLRLGPGLAAYLTDANICTDYGDWGEPCVWCDSGAPVMLATELQPYNLLAVSSWTVAPSDAFGCLSVHVRVASHLDWILGVIAVN